MIWRNKLGRPLFHDDKGELISGYWVRKSRLWEVEGSVYDVQDGYTVVHRIISEWWGTQCRYDVKLSRSSVDGLDYDGEVVGYAFTPEKAFRQTFVSAQFVVVSALSTRGSVAGAGVYALLDVPGFPIMEVESANVSARIEAIAAGLEQVAVRFPVRSYTVVMIVLVLLFVLLVAVAAGWSVWRK